ncbi:MAG TPA: uroporphyrinogen-III synthase, partial [Rubricoccaceae bacterium]|nr:uroporphyrinogen-III synthase [Rubricoccaceae bacterium]
MSATALPAQPLRGRRIAVTRARRQAAGFAERLEALGAEAILLPMIRVEPAEPGALRAAAAALDAYDWVVFTSVNGVDFFWPHLEATRGGRLPATTRVAAIGPATAQALRERGSDVDFVPEAFVAEALAERLPDVAGRRILLPRADIARPALADGLRARGAVVTDLAAYRTVAETPADGALAVLREGIDVVT